MPWEVCASSSLTFLHKLDSADVCRGLRVRNEPSVGRKYTLIY